MRTFYRWRNEHEAFTEALVMGKEHADQRVERALYERACGYDYESARVFHPAHAETPVIVPVTVHVPADVGAARFWLTARTPQPWAREKEKEEDDDLVQQLEAAIARTAEYEDAKRAEEARLFEERVAAGIAAGLADERARRGFQE